MKNIILRIRVHQHQIGAARAAILESPVRDHDRLGHPIALVGLGHREGRLLAVAHGVVAQRKLPGATVEIGHGKFHPLATNISTGVTAPATTKTINIGTGSGANSSTDIRIGSTAGGSITTINGNLVVGTILTVDQSVFSTGITTGITSSVTSIDTWAIATYRSAKYVLQVTCTAGTNINTYQVSEIVVIHDGSAAIMNEYSVIKTGNDLATFSVDIVSFTTFRLRAVAANSGDTITVKVQKMILTV